MTTSRVENQTARVAQIRAESAPPPSQAAVLATIGACRAHRLMGLIVGASGTGKTHGARIVASEPGTVYVRMIRAASRSRAGMAHIAAALAGEPRRYATAYDAYSATAAALKAARLPLLILDEAQYMAADLVDAVRDLHDTLGAGVVLIGNSGLRRRLERLATATGGGQIVGRIGPSLALDEPTRGDVHGMAREAGIAGRKSLAAGPYRRRRSRRASQSGHTDPRGPRAATRGRADGIDTNGRGDRSGGVTVSEKWSAEPLTAGQMRLIHTARRALKLSDAQYRTLLDEAAGTRSSRELMRGDMDAVMRAFRSCGFEHRARHARSGFASDAQIALIRIMYAEAFGSSAGLDKWLRRHYRVGGCRMLSPSHASNAIEGLKAIRNRRADNAAVGQ